MTLTMKQKWSIAIIAIVLFVWWLLSQARLLSDKGVLDEIFERRRSQEWEYLWDKQRGLI